MANRKVRDNVNVEDDVAAQSGMPTSESKEPAFVPSYRVVGDSRIPVAKASGSLWESRMKNAIKLRDKDQRAWRESIKYYNNDQLQHRRDSDGDTSGNITSGLLTTYNSETENIVFSNVTTLTAVIYAKNPEVEITSESEETKQLMTVVKDLVNVLAAKTQAPGFDLKPKGKRCVAIAELTNMAWLELGWTSKEDSSDAVMQEYLKYSDELAEAKNTSEVEKAEAKLKALESKVALSAPKGINVKVRSPFNVIKDPTSVEKNLSDCGWIVVIDYLLTDYINTMFCTEDEDGQYKSIYKPTHTMSTGNKTNDVQSVIDNFTLLPESNREDFRSMGFTSYEAYQNGCYTEVAFVWDKTKKQLLLYATNDWSWPIWVWDDPMKLDRFFPLYQLGWYEGLLSGTTKGETTFYLDQQDAINEINDEERRAREWLKKNIFFDVNSIKKEDVEAVLKGPDGTVRGVDLPEGKTMKDVLYSITPPGFAFYEMFAQMKASKIEAINRISSMNDVLSGVQFKTNTTNQAIGAYQQSSSIRTDDRTDSLEDFFGEFFWGVIQLCLMNYSAEEVGEILNRDVSAIWKQLDPQKLQHLAARVVGGSTTKPTSRAKQEQAVKVSQALGQFANAAPMVIIVMLELLEQAFDEIVISDDQWKKIIDSVKERMQSQVGGAPGAEGGQPQQGGDPNQQQGGNAEQILSQLDPKLQQVVQAAMNKGVPIETALQEVQKVLQGGNPNQ